MGLTINKRRRPVLWAWVFASRIFLSCSLILACIGLPVSLMTDVELWTEESKRRDPNTNEHIVRQTIILLF